MKMVLLRGMPGSGKSTLAKRFVDKSPEVWEHFEADMFFMDGSGNYKFNPAEIKHAHQWCQTKTEEALAHGYNVIISNTFTTKWEMRVYFDIAKKFNIIPEVILLQNQFESVHDVPEDVMRRMEERFEYNISELFESLKNES